jgi:hypothetical protein
VKRIVAWLAMSATLAAVLYAGVLLPIERKIERQISAGPLRSIAPVVPMARPVEREDDGRD